MVYGFGIRFWVFGVGLGFTGLGCNQEANGK